MDQPMCLWVPGSESVTQTPFGNRVRIHVVRFCYDMCNCSSPWNPLVLGFHLSPVECHRIHKLGEHLPFSDTPLYGPPRPITKSSKICMELTRRHCDCLRSSCKTTGVAVRTSRKQPKHIIRQAKNIQFTLW